MTLLNLMLKTGCKLIERELIISFPTNKVGKKSKKQEEENRVKHNVPILGPIIFFPNPSGSPFNEHDFSPSEFTCCK